MLVSPLDSDDDDGPDGFDCLVPHLAVSSTENLCPFGAAKVSRKMGAMAEACRVGGQALGTPYLSRREVPPRPLTFQVLQAAWGLTCPTAAEG